MNQEKSKLNISLICAVISALLLGLLYFNFYLHNIGHSIPMLFILCLAIIPFTSAILAIIALVVAISEKKSGRELNISVWILAIIISAACLIVWVIVAILAIGILTGFIV